MSEVQPTSPSLFPDLPPPLAEGTGRIRPRARLLRTIGAELISSEVVAVIELVRNCYDADATRVEIVFTHPENANRASLEIRDNGHGMTREVLLGPWLEPATDHKSGECRDGTGGNRSPAGRRRLGSKGVGRFAAQRLGTKLDVRTRAIGMDTELTARFDWSGLEKDTYLDQVRVPWREGTPEHVDPNGTHLYITRLRDRWSAERFERLRLGLSRLVSPSIQEEFDIRIIIDGAPEEVEPAIDAKAAMYSISGEVDAEGHAVIRYHDINGDTETWERTVYWPQDESQQCGPFEFRVNAWDLDREPLKLFLDSTDSKLGLRDFRRAIRDHSGVSLYRDGFRILPYGEAGDDWLQLNQRRVNNPTMKLSNNQILGSIQLTADQNPHLSDQTNREGLVTNEAYSHLAEVVKELLGYLESRRYNARRAMDIDWQRRSSSLPEMHDDKSTSELDRLITRLAQGKADRREDAKQLRLQLRDFRESTADAVRHYAGLAAAGQLSALVFRQLDHPIRQIRSDLKLVLGDLGAGSLDEDDIEDVVVSVQRALQHLETMEKRMHTLDPLAIGGRGRRVSIHRLDDVLLEVIEPFEEEFHRQGVVFDYYDDQTVKLKTNREVVQQVFANLLDNAVWFSRMGESPTPTVTVRVTPTGFTISDNGIGIRESHRDAVFEPHFTTRDDAHGLGLTLVRDLLKTIGGRVHLTQLKSATFAVDLVKPKL